MFHQRKKENIEIIKNIKRIQGNNILLDKKQKLEKIKEYLTTGDKKKIIVNIKKLDNIKNKYNIKRLKYSNLNKDELCEHIIVFVDSYI